MGHCWCSILHAAVWQLQWLRHAGALCVCTQLGALICPCIMQKEVSIVSVDVRQQFDVFWLQAWLDAVPCV